MRCGKCNAYIPDLSSITACPECGISLHESQKLHDEVLDKKKIAKEKAAEDLRKSQRSFDYVEAIAYSFFSKYFYRDVLRRWSGWGIAYLSFITALWMIPALIAMQGGIKKSFEKDLLPIIKQVPHLTIADGQIRYEGSDPYVIRGNKNSQIIIYLTRSSDPIDMTLVPAWYLVKPTQVVMRDVEGGSRTLNVQPKFNFTVTAEIIEYWAGQIIRWTAFFAYPIFWMTMILMVLFAAIFYALFGKAAAFLLQIPSDFQNLYRLTIVALTPSLFLVAAAMTWDSPGDVLDWASVLSPFFFITIGLWHNREPRKKATA